MNNTEENNTDNTDNTENTETTAKVRRVRKPKIERAIFIEAWSNASNLSEVAQVLGIANSSASVRASQMRRAGEPLKEFARGRKAGQKSRTTILRKAPRRPRRSED